MTQRSILLRRIAAIGVLSTLLLAPLTATAASKLPVGTPSQIADALLASTTNTKLSSVASTQIRNAAGMKWDWPWVQYKNLNPLAGCSAPTGCTYGDAKAKKSIVLYGDSHAMMWLPAVAPWATANHYKVYLFWQPGCPINNITNNYTFLGPTVSYNTSTPQRCDAWRPAAISAIKTLHPALILVGERTSDIIVGSSGTTLFSQATWQAALTATLANFTMAGTKVAMIQDIPYRAQTVPQCVAMYGIQRCAITYPTTATFNGVSLVGQQAAEEAAAAATGATFIPTIPWMCTSSTFICEPVIAGTITYWDQSHVSATYSTWLSGVFGTAINNILTP